MKPKPAPEKPKEPTKAEVVALQVIEVKKEVKSTTDFFHTAAGAFYAFYPVAVHKETHPVRSQRFKSHLRNVWWNKYHTPLPKDLLSDMLTYAETIAEFEGEEREVFLRVASDTSGVFVDLCNDVWQQVHITKDGWSVVSESPIRFIRRQGMLPLPYPKADKHGLVNLDKLLSNLPPDDCILCKSFLLGCFHPTGSYPTLVLVGQQGTGKSTVANIIIGLIDPSEQGCATLPHGDRNMMIAASKSWLPAFDNISVLNASQQDLFCRLNTGTGWRHRALRTDDQELIIKVKRPVLLNSINDGIVTRPDLADRSLLVHCNVISEVQRRLETSSVMGGDKEVGIMDEFNQHKAGILGTVLTAVAAALRNQNTVKLKSKPRMADFVRWAVAGAEPLGITEFQVAYARSRASLVENSLEAAPIYPALEALIIKDHRMWNKSMFTIYDELLTYNDSSKHPIKDFPRNARDLREHLNRLAPSLRAIKVLVTFDDKLESGTRRRMVKIDASKAS